MTGKFITFEGPDGSGKTSVIEAIQPLLEELVEEELVITREPGGSHIAESIRQVILNPVYTAMDSRTEALLYAASRRQHLVEVVFPALQVGKWVLSDRYLDSSLVYQGMARGIGVQEVYEMNQFATEGLMPDLTLYLDIKAEVGLERIQTNRQEDEINRLDNESLSFHSKVREGYLLLAEKFPERIHFIDANQSISDVSESCLDIIRQFAENKINEVE